MSVSSTQLPRDTAGLYVHVPFCEAKCRYCGFYSEPVAGHDPERLVSALITELDRYRQVASIETIYLGGGTPTSLPVSLLAGLLEAAGSRWPGTCEFTVECNPAQTDAEVLSVLRDKGVNRLSFGVQSFNDEELVLLGRRHDLSDAVGSIQQAGEFGFDNIALDLIFAIPGSTLGSWKHTLRCAVELGVQHISAYSLSFEEGTPLHEARTAGQIEAVDEETDRAMYELAIDYLALARFRQYEISNFALDGYECIHNQGYWENRPYIGIGPSAGSYWQGRRTLNVSDVGAYIRRIEAGLDACEEVEQPDSSQRICETAVLNLRRREGISLSRFKESTGADFADVFGKPIDRYLANGLMETDGETVRLTRNALPIADSILCDFAAI